MDEAERLVGARVNERILIAIDGRPVSGKTTLAARLEKRFGLPLLCIDDFMAPETAWRGSAPAFPFPFFRNEAFVQAVRSLKAAGACAYNAYDWEHARIGARRRTLAWTGPLIVEGCAALQAPLAPLYDLRFFIESGAASTFDAAMARDGRAWAEEWRTLFLPSVALYMETAPQSRADHLVAGRGAA
jgi:uridine kinase